MDEPLVRSRAEAFCDALLAGDVARAVEEMSSDLRSHVGPIVALMPLPLSEARVESVETGGSGFVAVLRLVGESGTIRLATRWKDREGKPTVVEVTHVPDEDPSAGPAESEAGDG